MAGQYLSGPVGDAPSSRIVTVPNALSALRLLGVPLFLWLALVQRADGWAVVMLFASSTTDWVDGKIARAWGQTSRLGQLLDPLADRLYILSSIVALTARSVIPLVLAVLLLGRDVALSTALPVLRRHGYGPLPVHFLGKAGTFNVLAALPWLFLGAGNGALAAVARPLGWAFFLWGLALYWWAGVLYAVQVRELVLADRAADRHSGPGASQHAEAGAAPGQLPDRGPDERAGAAV